jgi:hypothetical protein
MQFNSPFRLNNNNNNFTPNKYSNKYYKNFRHDLGIFSKEKQIDNSIINKSNYKFLNKENNSNNYSYIKYQNEKNSNKDYYKIYQNENFLTRILINFQIYKNSKNKNFNKY